MLQTLKFTLLLFFGMALLNACDSTENASTSADTTSVAKSDLKIVVEKPPMAVTTLDFMEDSFDFGKIKEGEKVDHVFKFKNTGENPLVLQDARASCGCTIPEYTKDTIAPGAEGKIKVIYDSAGKKGQINKTVTVTANTEPTTTDIKISAFVIEKAAGPYNK